MNNKSRFTMNALVVIVIAFSAIGLFFTVGIYDMGSHVRLVSDYQPIGDTGLSIIYSTKETCGIYRGTRYDNELVLEGNFVYDPQTAVSDGRLYLNEYRYSNADLMFCDAVCVDTESFEKTVIMKDAMILGCCGSGELVCFGSCLLQTDHPDVNSLCRLYGMTSPDLDPASKGAVVSFIEPASGEIVCSEGVEGVLTESLREQLLSRDLEEVRK